jgi:hypothetical protein
MRFPFKCAFAACTLLVSAPPRMSITATMAVAVAVVGAEA